MTKPDRIYIDEVHCSDDCTAIPAWNEREGEADICYVNESLAVEFAGWAYMHGWNYSKIESKWYINSDINIWQEDINKYYTNEELFDKFLKTKTK